MGSKQKRKKLNAKKITQRGKITFGYIDSKNDCTYREVDVSHIYDKYLERYYHLAREFRTFRLDRIQGDIVYRERERFYENN